ncbi:MAG: serine hydrolase domain-containing protein [Bacteroidota bacterium]
MHYLSTICVLLLLSFYTPTASAQTSATQLDALMEDLWEQTQVAGMALSVSQSDSMIYSKAWGMADAKGEIPMKPTTRVRTASVAKVLTATALGKLATDGKLDFDKPLKSYLPYLNAPYANLTTRQIAGHTAGIPHRPASQKAQNKHYTDVKETLPFFDKVSLLFEPDMAYKYSTLGYNLLAILIQEISGKPYADFMKEDIFMPLHMNQTAPDDHTVFSEEDAQMYYLKKGKLKQEKKIQDGSYKLAGAGFRSTSEDLVHMMRAYANGFISETVVQEMFRSHRLGTGEDTQVGIGWRINRDISGNPTIEHAGSWQGARTVIVYYPEQDLAISIMINTKCTFFIEETAHLIAEYFLHEAKAPEEWETPPKQLEVLNNRLDGGVETYAGEIKTEADGTPIMYVETERDWLKQNKLFPMPTADHFALSTVYGLLYLRLAFTPNCVGKLFLYQTLKDPYHMNQKPMLELREKL